MSTPCGDTITSPGLGYTINVGSYQSYFQTIHGIESFESALSLPNSSPLTFQYRNKLSTNKKFCIYYGFPSMVNGSTTIEQAVENFALYEIIVFPLVNQFIYAVEFEKFKEIVNRLILRGKKIYGYIQTGGQPINTIYNEMNIWTNNSSQLAPGTLGINENITGFLLDEFEIGFGDMSYPKMNQILDIARNNSISNPLPKRYGFILNGFAPTQIFLPSPIGAGIVLERNDKEFYLVESFGILDGEEITCSRNQANFNSFVQRINYILELGIQDFCLATTTSITRNEIVFNQDLFNEYYYMAELLGFVGFFWTEYNFSASNPTMPFYRFTGNPRDFLNEKTSTEAAITEKQGNPISNSILILSIITLLVFLFSTPRI